VPIRAVYREFGRRVRDSRTGSQITQDILAHQIGLSRTSVTNIERGRQAVLLHQVYDIARALDTTVQALLPEAEPAAEISAPFVDDAVPEGVRKFLDEEVVATRGRRR
jgi:DNA-binding XRE family transcriptional regulator